MILSYGQRRGLLGTSVILHHIERTGCTIAGQPVWAAAEIEALRALYPDRDAACSALPRRTSAAIAKKAQQLGLVPPCRIWSQEDAIGLRKPYVAGVPIATLVEMFLGKSREQIWKKAHHMGYRRPRRAPKPTGMPPLDGRSRCFRRQEALFRVPAPYGLAGVAEGNGDP